MAGVKVGVLLFFLSLAAQAALVRVEVAERSPILGGQRVRAGRG
jgi:hypothetical protein